MKAKTILDAEKKDAIDIATELCYSEEVTGTARSRVIFLKGEKKHES
jgi:hypothetical protein